MQGVLVNHNLQTNIEHIYAAGDVAQGPDLSTGEQQVHAIQPTAAEHGRIAACQMAGAPVPYRGSLSMNVLNTLGTDHQLIRPLGRYRWRHQCSG